MPLFAQFPFIYDDDELMENTLSIKHSLNPMCHFKHRHDLEVCKQRKRYQSAIVERRQGKWYL
ncbi:hypothetical protein HBI55_014240 [Parastagonospora nodorum]|nr:hypothetical protein HBI01_076310 [Parastagonospora nodorum]KAH4330151.1 hypothetical protein HBI00_086450 [Parastagonospora nodorum]KAH4392781.1 hypothetical protein HBH94_003070 [Parastagonospora nodorum]KAH4536720.1 hypothetical protein HBH87_001550 [Parastagonospora nodorum]KAH4595777.1 hypothetical protein HBH83_023720 [Parastagonospora nodorum]